MPDVLTHIFCGLDVMNRLEDSRWKAIIREHEKLFKVGCQGPDFFLYNDFWPWIKKKRGVSLGRRIHTEKTAQFFVEGLKYLRKHKSNTKAFEALFAYLTGFICHFGLDRNAHPYVHYYAGVYDRENPKTKKYSMAHKRLELMIDAILLKERKGMAIHEYPVYKEVEMEDTFVKNNTLFLQFVMKRLFDYRVQSEVIRDSYKDMMKLLKITHDKRGFKKLGLELIELISFKKLNYSGLIYPRNIQEGQDYMNKKHSLWNHPCNKKEVYNDSFYDVFERGIKESLEMIIGAIHFLEDEIGDTELRRVFPDISYSTGKSTTEKCHLRYYASIFK